MRNLLPLVLGILITLLIVLLVAKQWMNMKLETKSEQTATVLLEKINKVYKLVVVEGEFAEILSHQDYYGFDLPGFRKKAIIKIEAKVSVGYNLDSLRVVTDEVNKVIKVQKWPDPEILSIDSDISYYDIDNGVFNSFTPQELTKITQDAKDAIRKKAQHSSLMPAAKQQQQQMFDMISLLAESSGWRVEIDPSIPVNPKPVLPDDAPKMIPVPKTPAPTPAKTEQPVPKAGAK